MIDQAMRRSLSDPITPNKLLQVFRGVSALFPERFLRGAHIASAVYQNSGGDGHMKTVAERDDGANDGGGLLM
ncbi:MAG: hypothetical protein WDN46_25285 [Methylocella sp.]